MKTKNITWLVCLCSAFCLTLSCDDFLEEEALDTLTSENFPQTLGDAEALANQVYRMAGGHFASFRYPDIVLYPTEFATTRQAGAGNVRAQLDDYRVNNSNSHIARSWQEAYQVIRQANVAIGAINQIDENDPNIDSFKSIEAEVKVLRAYVYYDLLIIFGEVPLILDRLQSLEDAENPTSPISDIYESVIRDLLEAEPVLPHATEDIGRVTRGAARALLGNVYLQRSMDPAGVAQSDDLDNAITWLRRVVNAEGGGKTYSLEPDFNNLFGLENVNSSKYSDEIIFQFWRDINQCCRNAYYSNSNARDTPFGAAWGNTVAEVPFYLSFDTADERFAVTFFDTINHPTRGTIIYDYQRPWADSYQHDGPAFQKWIDPNHDRTASNNNVFVIRYAEVLLNLSEALTRREGAPTAEALDLLNQVRNRSKLPNLDPVPGSLADMEVALFNEYRWETAFEANGLTDAHRFFPIFKERVEANSRYEQPPVPDGVQEDSGRRNDAAPDVPITLTIDMLRMPIPLTELDANPAIDGGN
ncbi:MAG: RagB/SusD family nutrient uptake outer membrane protein [Bacteroidota bacterium]